MSGNFEIFEDTEKFAAERKLPKYGELKRDKSKLVPLASNDYNDENFGEQVCSRKKCENFPRFLTFKILFRYQKLENQQWTKIITRVHLKISL